MNYVCNLLTQVSKNVRLLWQDRDSEYRSLVFDRSSTQLYID